MRIADLNAALEELLAGDDRPVAVFSALWPIARACAAAPEALCEALGAALTAVARGRTLMMPTFTGGYADGVCNLDEEPGTTGLLTEHFRKAPGTRRTRSAFFSFGVTGPGADALVALAPEHAWGEGSVYAWMYEHDAWIVTLGLHPTHCSYSHHAEWLMRDAIPYRYEKSFEGELIHEGTRTPFRETLLVRQRDPAPVNDFTPFLDAYLENGMRTVDLDGVQLSKMSARTKADLLAARIAEDPFAVVSNRRELKRGGA